MFININYHYLLKIAVDIINTPILFNKNNVHKLLKRD